MKKFMSFVFLSASLLVAGPVFAGFSVMTGWSVAPNSNTSPSWGGYLANFATFATTGGEGDRSLSPSAFENLDTNWVLPGSVTTSSGFNSWEGVASPSSPFNAEFGNRPHNWFIIYGDSVSDTIALQDISYTWDSDYDTMDFSGDYSSANYSSAYIGVTSFGGDGQFGGGDDTYTTNGQSGSDAVFAILGVGIGNGLGDYGSGGNQQRLDNVYNFIAGRPGSTINNNVQYDFGNGVITNSSLAITTIPEPSSIIMVAAAFSASLLVAYRKKNR